jgi:protoporphyrinogen oxidase
MTKQDHIVSPIRIIGGGMTGLTLGLRLAQRGLPVVIHERDSFLGGLSSESVLDCLPIDRFYHCVLPTDTTLLELFDEIGLTSDNVGWRKTRTGFLSHGRLLEMTTTRDFITFPELHMLDRLRLGWTLLYCSMTKNWKDLDGQPVGEFLRQHGGQRLFESIWEPLLVSKLGPQYDRFAATFIWATIKRMLMARKAQGRAEMLGFVKGRYGKVFDAMRRKIESLGGRVLGGQNIEEIHPNSGGQAPWILRVNGLDLPAAGIVLCVPAQVAAKWIRGIMPAVADTLDKTEYLGVVCEALLLREQLTPFYILNLIDRPMPFTGVIEFTNLAGREEFGGHCLVYLPRYAGIDSPVWQRNDEAIHRENVAGLQKVAPGFSSSSVVDWQINRAYSVQPVHKVGGGGKLPPVEIAPGLAYLSTVHVHPWPVYNDEVVRLVDKSLAKVIDVLNANPKRGG